MEFTRSRDEAANAMVCKTALHGCNSHRYLDHIHIYDEGDDAVICNYCIRPVASKEGVVWK